MNRLAFILGSAVALSSSHAVAHDTKFCDRLRAFETADLPANGDQARWIELHWLGSWLNFETGWGKTCISSGDPEAISFCEYVVENSSYEFAEAFPLAILTCHGFKLPSASSVGGLKADIELSHSDDRWHVLKIDFSTIEGETGAVRYISINDETAGGTDIEHDPLRPLATPNFAKE